MSESAPSLRLSTLFTKTSQTLASHSEAPAGLEPHPHDSEDFTSNPYVLNIANLPSHYAIATSAPSNAIRVLDKRTLTPVTTLGSSSSGSGSKTPKTSSGMQAHAGGITSLKSYPSFMGQRKGGLMSAGKDGRVVLWDERSPSGDGSLSMFAPSSGSRFRSLLCCDIAEDGFTVAAGTELQGDDALIVYWDPRNASKPLRVHSQTHSDDITVVQFAPPGIAIKPPSPSDPSIPALSPTETASLGLLSASSDGLLCLSNANHDDEDEAVLVTSNWGCSIAQAGWIGSHGIWASSDMETFSTWTCELEQRMNMNIREPSLHGDSTWVTDYTITCHAAVGEAEQMRPLLSVYIGSNEGDVALISTPNPLPPSLTRKLSKPNATVKPWTIHGTYTHSHTDVVRSLLVDEENGVLVTGGEDSKLCVWKDKGRFDDGDLWSTNMQDESAEMDVSMEDVGLANEPENRGKKRVWDAEGDLLMEDEQEEKRLRRG